VAAGDRAGEGVIRYEYRVEACQIGTDRWFPLQGQTIHTQYTAPLHLAETCQNGNLGTTYCFRVTRRPISDWEVFDVPR
jgi:hypothetical protein